MKKGQTRRKRQDLNQRLYTPHEGLVNNMKDLLHLHKSPEKVSATDENAIRHMKHYYCPRVFQAMADLTFFFEAISMYPELRQEFQLETMDLLGVKRLNPRRNPYGFMLAMLISGILCIRSPDEYDFRVKLVHILQKFILAKIDNLEIVKTLDSSSIIKQQMHNAKAWTEMLAQRVDDIYKFEILGDATEKKRITAFEEDAKKKEPARTFEFNTKELLEG